MSARGTRCTAEPAESAEPAAPAVSAAAKRTVKPAGRRTANRTGGRAAAQPTTLVVDDLEVLVTRKPIKNMYVRVKPPNGEVAVSAPMRMPTARIESFVREHRTWILRQRKRTERPASAEWTEERRMAAAQAINAQLPALLAKWGPIMGRTPTHITLRLMSSRWGSCTPSTGRIRLNLQLGLMEPRFLEYVLVHEMTHLWANGHGAEFQRIMSAALPNWRQLRRDLNRQLVL